MHKHFIYEIYYADTTQMGKLGCLSIMVAFQ